MFDGLITIYLFNGRNPISVTFHFTELLMDEFKGK